LVALKIPLFCEIIGEPAVGKTHLSLQFPDPVLLDTTPRGEAMPIVMKIFPKTWKERWVRIRRFQDLRNAVNQAIRDKRRTVVVDTGADLRQLGAEEYCKEKSKKAVYPLTEWRWVNEKIKEFIDRVLIDGEMNLVFTAQMKDEWKIGPDRQLVKVGRQRDGYPKMPFYADLRLYMVLSESSEKVERRVYIVKNRFVDRASSEWVSELKPPFSFESIMKLTRLPEEMWVR